MSRPHLTAPTLPGLLGALLLFMACAPASAQSLMERRNAMQKGTNEGVVIIGGPQAAKPGETPGEGDAAATATTPDTERRTGLGAIFSKLPPPSGCPMERARNGGCPDQGIAVPTGAPSSSNTPNFSRASGVAD